jgi:hypothetical protein
MLSLVTWTTALVVSLGAGAKPLSERAILESPSRNVRATNPSVASLLRAGFEQSPTFAGLMRRLAVSDVLVYIEEVPRLPGAMEGRMVIQPPAHGFRYLRIQITRRGATSDTIALLGHELRHAVEVAESLEVTDEQSLAVLYRRIGVAHGDHLFDTRAAQDTGAQVRRELIT